MVKYMRQIIQRNCDVNELQLHMFIFWMGNTVKSVYKSGVYVYVNRFFLKKKKDCTLYRFSSDLLNLYNFKGEQFSIFVKGQVKLHLKGSTIPSSKCTW